MDKKQDIVVRAAQKLFLKYGYTKVNMGDIAKAANMSRPLLYTMFKGKDDIFENVIWKIASELTEKAQKEIVAFDHPLEKLEKLLQIWVLDMFEELSKSEEAKELYECSYGFVQETMNKVNDLFLTDIENVLQQFPKESLNGGLNPKELAAIFLASIVGFKKTSENVKDLKSKIQLLTRATINP
ncbi:TetR/AcrR family transcriptional regulator [Labilibaculum sp.]|uniref:TetR/AcrR family transcriptional regulator n=1 Tax=Labilibaculum sp. TaxID=2060723 RepID=UPI003568D8C2